nr:MAG TPA: hypothetical protein [Caudoviricetes sp.]DAX83870.1 MAG TPA: hypothetical protein [Caudoviricetes sp.]
MNLVQSQLYSIVLSGLFQVNFSKELHIEN